MQQFETILIDKNDGVTTITFNRPEKRNAMNPRFHREMYEALIRLEGDDETRVLVLTGAGSSFCAGQDLKEYFKEVEDNRYERDLNRRMSNEWRDRLLRMFPRPTIAKVNGFCFGGAFTIVASCDFAVAADEAVFGLSEVNWGSIPGGLVSKAISGVMSYRDALYYALTGEQFDGKRAAEIRFVNRSVPLERLDDEVATLARRMATMDPSAVRSTKEAFKQVVDMNYEQAYWWLMAKSNELRWLHQKEGKGREGIDKFLAKEYRPGVDSFTRAGQEAKE